MKNLIKKLFRLLSGKKSNVPETLWVVLRTRCSLDTISTTVLGLYKTKKKACLRLKEEYENDKENWIKYFYEDVHIDPDNLTFFCEIVDTYARLEDQSDSDPDTIIFRAIDMQVDEPTYESI